jgi:hypothetical protein
MTMGAVHEPPLLQRHRLTADEYQRLGRAQVLAPDARVELIDGEVIDMAPIGTRHWAVVSRLQRLLHDAVGHRAVIATQLSLRLGTHSEPQPDLALFKPRDDFYIGALPQADDTILLIEVADTTARYKREIKLPLYARQGVVEFWIVDLEANLLRMHRRPSGEHYAEVSETATPGIVTIAALPEVRLDLTGLLSG